MCGGAGTVFPADPAGLHLAPEKLAEVRCAALLCASRGNARRRVAQTDNKHARTGRRVAQARTHTRTCSAVLLSCACMFIWLARLSRRAHSLTRSSWRLSVRRFAFSGALLGSLAPACRTRGRTRYAVVVCACVRSAVVLRACVCVCMRVCMRAVRCVRGHLCRCSCVCLSLPVPRARRSSPAVYMQVRIACRWRALSVWCAAIACLAARSCAYTRAQDDAVKHGAVEALTATLRAALATIDAFQNAASVPHTHGADGLGAYRHEVEVRCLSPALTRVRSDARAACLYVPLVSGGQGPVRDFCAHPQQRGGAARVPRGRRGGPSGGCAGTGGRSCGGGRSQGAYPGELAGLLTACRRRASLLSAAAFSCPARSQLCAESTWLCACRCVALTARTRCVALTARDARRRAIFSQKRLPTLATTPPQRCALRRSPLPSHCHVLSARPRAQELTAALATPAWCGRFVDIAVRADSAQEEALECLTAVSQSAGGRARARAICAPACMHYFQACASVRVVLLLLLFAWVLCTSV